MHKNGYVVAVLANGQVLEEDGSNKVCLPFGAEYKVRLINKNYDRCAADLIINGDKIARFIVGAGETADIERYLDGNLHSGSKFKFTHLHDSAIKDKNSFENGLVEVLYYKEKYRKPEPLIIREEHHHWPPWKAPMSTFTPWTVTYDSCENSLRGFGTSMQCNAISMASAGQEGATVRGSSSSQSFSEVSGLEFESNPTIIKLKLVNGDLQTSQKYCTGCGRKKSGADKYCANCGIKY